AAYRVQAAQRDDQRGDMEPGDDDAHEGADCPAYGDPDADREDNRQAVVQAHGRHEAAERRHRPHGQVDAAADQDEGHGDGHDERRGGGLDDPDQVGVREEVVV